MAKKPQAEGFGAANPFTALVPDPPPDPPATETKPADAPADPPAGGA